MTMRHFIRRNRPVRFVLALPLAARQKFLAWKSASGRLVLSRLAALSSADVHLHVAEFNGNFALSANSHLFQRILLNGEYEPRLAQLFRDNVDPSRDILDVGANVGFFSVLSSQLLDGGRVLSVEPTSAAYDRLRRNCAANCTKDNLIFFKGVAANEAGEMKINVVPGREEYSSVGGMEHFAVKGVAVKVETVPSRTIDSLVEEHGLRPGLMKVDVEGGEMSVFLGAEKTLREHRPVVISELSDTLLKNMGSSGLEVVNFLEGLGYSVSNPIDPSVKPGTSEYGDIIAIPR